MPAPLVDDEGVGAGELGGAVVGAVVGRGVTVWLGVAVRCGAGVVAGAGERCRCGVGRAVGRQVCAGAGVRATFAELPVVVLGAGGLTHR